MHRYTIRHIDSFTESKELYADVIYANVIYAHVIYADVKYADAIYADIKYADVIYAYVTETSFESIPTRNKESMMTESIK